jgi:circadian clock protein KaiB
MTDTVTGLNLPILLHYCPENGGRCDSLRVIKCGLKSCHITEAISLLLFLKHTYHVMSSEKHILTLYIAGNTQKSRRAIENINNYCQEHLSDGFSLEIIDLKEHPELASSEQIIATPTLIRKLPAPIRVLVGDLSDKEKVLVGLNIKPA